MARRRVPEAWTKGTFCGTLVSSVCCSCTTFWPVQKSLQGEALQLFLRVFAGQGVHGAWETGAWVA